MYKTFSNKLIQLVKIHGTEAFSQGAFITERKKSFRKFDIFSFAVWTNVKRKRASDEEEFRKRLQIVSPERTGFSDS